MLLSKTVFLSLNFLFAAFLFSCQTSVATQTDQNNPAEYSVSPNSAQSRITEISSDEIKMLESAVEQTGVTRTYDPAYVVLKYPMGDVPMKTGVCSDVVIRAFRRAGVDLQKEVHEDMRGSFSLYPKKWGLKSPDTNIDHRRVPNLQTFFYAQREISAITNDPANYKPGDVVAWHLDNKGTTHIGLVSNSWNENTKRYSIIHNIGGGANLEDVLFDWKIIGHYRYF